jgi:hypothetical protein
MTRAESLDLAVIASGRSLIFATGACFLDGRAGNGPIGTEDAAIPFLRLEKHATCLAFVEIDARLRRHAFGLFVPAFRAGNDGSCLNHRAVSLPSMAPKPPFVLIFEATLQIQQDGNHGYRNESSLQLQRFFGKCHADSIFMPESVYDVSLVVAIEAGGSKNIIAVRVAKSLGPWISSFGLNYGKMTTEGEGHKIPTQIRLLFRSLADEFVKQYKARSA